MTRRIESHTWSIGTIPGAWVADAICPPHPLAWWFPSKASPRGRHAPTRRHVHDRTVWARARAICERCPVIADCLAHAIDNDEHDGMWGGRTPHERRTITARRTA